jgi:peptide deformylase
MFAGTSSNEGPKSMAIAKLNVVEAGADVLRARAVEVPARLFKSQELKDFVRLMLVTMKEAPGVGLAAPQIGVPLRIFVFGDTDNNSRYLTAKEQKQHGRVVIGPEVWINPSFTPTSDIKVTFFEGCLSVPGFQAKVERYGEVELRGLDENGDEKDSLQLRGWPARIVQHEIDHLDGVLYVDRMDSKTLATTSSLSRKAAHDLNVLLGLT